MSLPTTTPMKPPTPQKILTKTHDELLVKEDEVELIVTKDLPRCTTINFVKLVNYQGFWYLDLPSHLASVIAFQRHFQARDTDLILASFPKTGTTWMKSLLFAVINREKYDINNTPLLTTHPHELVCRLEAEVYGNAFDYPRPNHLDEMPLPRLFNTHMAYSTLPESIKSSDCKVIYVSRNPMDVLVSMWYFHSDAMKKYTGDDSKGFDMEKMVEDFIQGRVFNGPYFDHVVEYWKESLERPNKVLFLKYEDLKSDLLTNELKKVAQFVGLPFTPEEESEGVVKDIVDLCSIGKMKEMEGNKNGVFNKFYDKKSYFRKGEVGGYGNYIDPSTVERIKAIMKEKFESVGLMFDLGN